MEQDIKPSKNYIIEDFDPELLRAGAEDLGIVLTDTQLGQFERYYYFLLNENKKYNLTGLKTCKDVILKHFVDSLTILPVIDRLFGTKAIRMVDIGTGAGFPAVPIHILRPDDSLTLLDSNNKKIKFLDLLKTELNMEYITVWARAEEEQKRSKGSFDLVLMRGVGTIGDTAGYALPFLTSGGYFVTQKSVQSDSEISDSTRELRKLGGSVAEVEDILLPVSMEPRRLVIIKKG